MDVASKVIPGRSGDVRKPLRQEVRDESSGQGARTGPKGTGAVARAPPLRTSDAEREPDLSLLRDFTESLLHLAYPVSPRRPGRPARRSSRAAPPPLHDAGLHRRPDLAGPAAVSIRSTGTGCPP